MVDEKIMIEGVDIKDIPKPIIDSWWESQEELSELRKKLKNADKWLLEGEEVIAKLKDGNVDLHKKVKELRIELGESDNQRDSAFTNMTEYLETNKMFKQENIELKKGLDEWKKELAFKSKQNAELRDTLKELKVYKVGIVGMCGWYEVKYFIDKNKANECFDNLIKEKKADKSTLKDDECEEYGEGKRNFDEHKVYDLVINKKSERDLKSVSWSYGQNSTSEDGTEFYTYTDFITMSEVCLLTANIGDKNG